MAFTLPACRYEQPANAGISAAVKAFCEAVEAGNAPEPLPAYHSLALSPTDGQRADLGFFLLRLVQERCNPAAEQVSSSMMW